MCIYACTCVVDYRRQTVELREAGVAKEELANDRRRLEDQLRKKDEESRMQEEELAKLRSMLTILKYTYYTYVYI